MEIGKLIKCCLSYKEMSMAELADKLGVTQQNVSQRLKVGKFTTNELNKIAEKMGAEYHAYFLFPDGTKIE